VILTAQGVNALLKTVVNNEGTIEAQTIGGAKGRMVLNGGTGGGTVRVAGKLDASGVSGASGASGATATLADGGTIVLAGAHVKIADSAVITAAGTAGTAGSAGTAAGKAGQLEIAASGFTVADSVTTISSGISAAALKNQLALNNVQIKTVAFASGGTGDIDIDAAFDWTTNNALTLEAHRHVNVNTAITATGDTAGLTLKQGSNGENGYQLNNSAQINLKADAKLVIAGKTYKIINDVTALQKMSQKLDDYYALGSDSIGFPIFGGMTPIGTEAASFSGILDGLGHKVVQLLILTPGFENVGLIGVNSGNVKNIGLVDVNVIGGNATGALVGLNKSNGKIHNVTASGQVKGAEYTGGLVGRNEGSISNTSMEGSVKGTSIVGGLVGYNKSGTISDATVRGTVEGNFGVGGLVGSTVGTEVSAMISNVTVSGSVTMPVFSPELPTDQYKGGLAGSRV